MTRFLSYFSVALLVACTGTGKLPFSDDELEPKEDPSSAGRGGRGGSAGRGGTSGSGGSAGRGGTGGSAGRGGTGGIAGRGGTGGSSGRGGSGGSGIFIECETEVSFSPLACNSCMRRSCCETLELCTSVDCLEVESCAERYGCFESSSFEACFERNCRGYGPPSSVYLDVRRCLSDSCSDFCE
jgi:hypothetical protein